MPILPSPLVVVSQMLASLKQKKVKHNGSGLNKCLVNWVKIHENKPFAQNCSLQRVGGNFELHGTGLIFREIYPHFF